MKSYNAYLGVPGTQEDPWECTATSVGYERVQPGSPYPPRRDPVDHHFDWDHGRVLSAYQLVYVTEGQGVFESEVSPKCHRIEDGAVMTLFPASGTATRPTLKPVGSNSGSSAAPRLSIGLETPDYSGLNGPFGVWDCRRLKLGDGR